MESKAWENRKAANAMEEKKSHTMWENNNSRDTNGVTNNPPDHSTTHSIKKHNYKDRAHALRFLLE